jgi:amino acid transporter
MAPVEGVRFELHHPNADQVARDAMTCSAYTYAYAVLGELVAWVIGWDLLLEYALVVAIVSIGWSGYLQALLSQLGLTLPAWAMGAPRTGAGHVLDLAAMLGSLAVGGLLTLRIEWGARFNAAMVTIKIAAVVLVLAAGLPYVHIKPDRLLDDFGREAVAAIADLSHPRWLRLKSLNGKPTGDVTMPARAIALVVGGLFLVLDDWERRIDVAHVVAVGDAVSQ